MAAARRVLLSATLFRPSGSSDALAITSDVRSTAFQRALEQLVDLSLLDKVGVELKGLGDATGRLADL